MRTLLEWLSPIVSVIGALLSWRYYRKTVQVIRGALRKGEGEGR